MSKSKIIAMMALIVFATGIILVNCAVAGEKVKGRTVTHNIKWQQIDVGDADGHVVAIEENKGVSANLEGKWFADGWSFRETGLYDINLKTGIGSAHGYGDYTDRDGNKWYFTWEGKAVKGEKYAWGGTWKAVKGTGKFEGIHGGGTWQNYQVGDQGYFDWEGDIELPR
jgi:hypothetical protein